MSHHTPGHIGVRTERLGQMVRENAGCSQMPSGEPRRTPGMPRSLRITGYNSRAYRETAFGTKLTESTRTRQLDRRISVAPMMDWTNLRSPSST